MDLGVRIEGPYDLKNPKEHRLCHPDVGEGTFHSCSSHLHALLAFFSVQKENIVLAKRLKFSTLQTDAMQHSTCKQDHANKQMSNWNQ